MISCEPDAMESRRSTAIAPMRSQGTSRSRDTAEAVGRFLVLAALVNGDFTMEEAAALREITDLLFDYCDAQGVAAGAVKG